MLTDTRDNRATVRRKIPLPVEMAWVVLCKPLDLTPTPSGLLARPVILIESVEPLLLYILIRRRARDSVSKGCSDIYASY
jgi:hypothetical protein